MMCDDIIDGKHIALAGDGWWQAVGLGLEELLSKTRKRLVRALACGGCVRQLAAACSWQRKPVRDDGVGGGVAAADVLIMGGSDFPLLPKRPNVGIIQKHKSS